MLTLFIFTFVVDISKINMSDSDSDFQPPKVKHRRIASQVPTTNTTNANPCDEEDSTVEILVENAPRRTYLITYAQVDKNLFPTRESFGKKCEEVFGGGKRVSMYACSEEPHGNGGVDYHVSIKLTKPQRWSTAKQGLAACGAIVNFAKPGNFKDGMYSWAYRYATKQDKDVYHSPGHPCLEDISKNVNKIHEANAAYRQKRRAESEARVIDQVSTNNKRKRLKNDDVAEYIRGNDIKTLNEFLADAETRRVEGDYSLSSFIHSRSLKNVSELIEVTWMMKRAVTKVQNLSNLSSNGAT